jgi:transporter family protein
MTTWVWYALGSAVLFAGWGFLSKIALRTSSPIQTMLVYGLMTVLVAGIALAVGSKTGSWGVGSLAVAAASALCGSTALVLFYAAVDQGKVTIVIPITSVYPAGVALLALIFLGERLSPLQLLGMILALAGVALLGAG